MQNKQKKILVVVPSIGIGGRERIAINTVRCFENLGYRTILVIFQRRTPEYLFTEEMINLNVPPAVRKMGRLFVQIKRSFRLAKLRREHKAEFVYSLGQAANLSNVLSGLSHWGKTIISIHGSGEVRKNLINRFMFAKADRTICIAQDMRHQLLSLYPELKNIRVVENGYDLTKIEQKKWISSSLRIVAMGRLVREKGYDRLIRILKIIQQSIPNAMLTIIGAGEQEKALKTLAGQFNVQKAVDFRGFLKEPFSVLLKHDIYVLTSYEEGFPNALIEALFCGLPIVAADCQTGPREILSETYSPEPIRGIKHEKYGILVDNSTEGFEERFAQAVIQLASDRNKMAYYSGIGPVRAKDFSLERYQNKLQQLLKECRNDKTG